MSKKAFTLTFKDGTTFTGELFGADTMSAGEVVFTTGLVGYPESLTDPSFEGQILVLTAPLVGNYGVPDSEAIDEYGLNTFLESQRMHIKGLIVCDYSDVHSHWNAKESLSEWMEKSGIPGISGIDTRALTQKLREEGSQLGVLHDAEAPAPTSQDFYDPNLENLVEKVSIKEVKEFGTGSKHIAVMDLGIKYNILKSLLSLGLKITLFPWNQSPVAYEKEKGISFDGYFFSNGPGDPALLKETVAIMQECFATEKPTFGICLGNQMMGIACGSHTYKLKYGHRGQNQPCIDMQTQKCVITSQNHGFAVSEENIGEDWDIYFINANDQTVEGLHHKTKPFFSVQFHPEACPGPSDTAYLFKKFADLL